MKKLMTIGSSLAVLALLLSSFGLQAEAAAPTVNVTGNYVISMEYQSNYYAHNVSLTQDSAGALTGNGSSTPYTWVITSGSVSANNVDFLANYTATADSVTPQTVLHIVGTVATDGKISGTWSDNYQGGNRSGTFTTTTGSAQLLNIKTITATAGANGSISPSGLVNVNKGEDKTFTITPNTGYRIKAVFVDGISVGAVSTYIFNDVEANHTISAFFKANKHNDDHADKKECKKGGWKEFTTPSFKNQGQCIKFVNKEHKEAKAELRAENKLLKAEIKASLGHNDDEDEEEDED